MHPALQVSHWVLCIVIVGVLLLIYEPIRDTYWAKCMRVTFSNREWVSLWLLKAGTYGIPVFIAWYLSMTWYGFELIPQTQMIIVGVGILLMIVCFHKKQSQWNDRYRHYQRKCEEANDRLRRNERRQ